MQASTIKAYYKVSLEGETLSIQCHQSVWSVDICGSLLDSQTDKTVSSQLATLQTIGQIDS